MSYFICHSAYTFGKLRFCIIEYYILYESTYKISFQKYKAIEIIKLETRNS